MEREVAVRRIMTALACCGVLLLATACSGDPVEPASSPSGDAAEADGTATADPATAPTSTEPSIDGTADESPPAEQVDEGLALLADVIEATEAETTSRTFIRTVQEGPAGELVVENQGVHDGDDSRVTITSSAGLPPGNETEAEIILVGDTTYQRRPALIEALGIDRNWLVFELEVVEEDPGPFGERLFSSTPRSALDPLRGATAVDVAGTEEINGVATTHLLVDVPTLAALELEDDRGALAELGLQPADMVRFDVWVDERSRLRRSVVEVDVGAGPTVITFDVLEYGLDAGIAPPPAEDTADPDTLFDLLNPDG